MSESQRVSLNHVQGQQVSRFRGYRRDLVLQERQAYEGAKMFYFGVLPLSIVGLIFFTAFLYEQSTNLLRQNIFKIQIYIALTLISYIVAVYYYIKCNKIEVYPASSSSQSKQPSSQTLTTKSNIELTPSFSENQNIQIQSTSNSQDNKPSRKYCSFCDHLCEYRTKHCKKCRTCVEKYDHHCFWIGNCVGKHNHRYFYLFLLIQTFNNWTEMKAILQLRSFANQAQIDLHWLIWLIIYTMLLTSIGFLCFTGYLAIYHTMLLTLSLTTWEQMRRDHISYLKYLPKGFNPFSIGWKNNIKKFFTQKTRANSQDCTLEHWHRFLPTFQEAKLIKPRFNFIDNEYYSCC